MHRTRLTSRLTLFWEDILRRFGDRRIRLRDRPEGSTGRQKKTKTGKTLSCAFPFSFTGEYSFFGMKCSGENRKKAGRPLCRPPVIQCRRARKPMRCRPRHAASCGRSSHRHAGCVIPDGIGADGQHLSGFLREIRGVVHDNALPLARGVVPSCHREILRDLIGIEL